MTPADAILAIQGIIDAENATISTAQNNVDTLTNILTLLQGLQTAGVPDLVTAVTVAATYTPAIQTPPIG